MTIHRTHNYATYPIAATPIGYTHTALHDEEVLWCHVLLTTSATVGNRNIRIAILDASDIEWADFHSGQQQAASLLRHYIFIGGTVREGNFVDIEIVCALPQFLYLPKGWKLKFEDSSAVSATDTVKILLQTRSLVEVEQ